MKSEKTIYTTIITCINSILKMVGFSDFVARQGGQSNLTTLQNNTPSVFVSLIGAPSFGWQHEKYRIENNELKHDEVFYQEFLFQCTALKRKSKDGEHTSFDCINHLVAGIRSDAGLKIFRDNGFGVLNIPEIRPDFWSSDSDIYERSPNFDLRVSCKQVLRTPTKELTGYEIGVKGV